MCMCLDIQRGQKRVSLPHARVTGSCEPPYCGFWKLNVDPLEKQEMLFTKLSHLIIPHIFLIVLRELEIWKAWRFNLSIFTSIC